MKLSIEVSLGIIFAYIWFILYFFSSLVAGTHILNVKKWVFEI